MIFQLAHHIHKTAVIAEQDMVGRRFQVCPDDIRKSQLSCLIVKAVHLDLVNAGIHRAHIFAIRRHHHTADMGLMGLFRHASDSFVEHKIRNASQAPVLMNPQNRQFPVMITADKDIPVGGVDKQIAAPHPLG